MLKAYIKSVRGNMSIMLALSIFVLLAAVGVAVDMNQLTSAKSNAQDSLDAAILAAAVYMDEDMADISIDAKRQNAKQMAVNLVTSKSAEKNFNVALTASDIIIEDSSVYAKANGSGKPVLVHMLGHENLDFEVNAKAKFGSATTNGELDLDIVIALDATASMEWLLDPLKDNIRLFYWNLSRELTSQGVDAKAVRIKIIIFRDWYSGESHVWRNIWHGPETLTALDWGPTYYSPFYELPHQSSQVGTYLDNFQARRGKDIAEAPIEAISHALHMNDWNPDSHKLILLWTDAPAKQTKLYALGSPDNNTTMNLPHYPDNENFVPWEFHKYEEVFNSFHQSNLDLMEEEDRADAISLSVNLYPNIKGYVGLGEWEKVKNWNGVDFNDRSYQSTDDYVANGFGEPVDFTPPDPDEVYKDVLDQVVKLVLSQTSEEEIDVYLSK